MTDYIGDKLSPTIIRVTKGCDRKFSLTRKDVTGAPLDWNATLVMKIGTSPVTSISATVTNNVADVRIESAVCDQVTNTTTWQLYMSETGAPTLETPLRVGRFQRQDGD